MLALLGASDAIALSFREGGHGYKPDDWTRFLDFASWRFFDAPRPEFDESPETPSSPQ